MPKRIPSKINPDVIAKTIFQIRFKLKIPVAEFLGHLYPILSPSFPKLEQKNLGIPLELIKLDPNLKFLTNYSFSNPEFSVAFGSNVLSFEFLNDYKGWNEYYAHIKNVLDKIEHLNIFESTERIGLRYSNIINGGKSLEDVLDFTLKLSLHENFVEKNSVLRKEFESEDIKVILNIAEEGTLRTLNSLKKGIIIDVDVSKVKELPKVGSSLLPLISKLHELEKFVFFNVLKQEYIDSLNPVY